MNEYYIHEADVNLNTFRTRYGSDSSYFRLYDALEENVLGNFSALTPFYSSTG